VKVTDNLHWPPAGTLLQVLVCAKSAGLAPAMVTLEMVSGEGPGFDSVTIRAPLAAPTF
jgi:hypothetical protein